jgi:Ca2+-binding RTX toxin-like protein
MADYTTILGTSTADSLIVSNTSGDDSLALLTGNDTVTGSGGIDIVDLGSGNDLMTQPGDYTAGTILGGSGNDTIHTASKFSGSEADGGTNNDSIVLVKNTTFSSATLSGGQANDTISVNSSSTLVSSSIYGAASTGGSTDGADSIELGTLSSSLLQGNAGNDTFYVAGKTTNSTTLGGRGNDYITTVGTIAGSYVGGNRGSDSLILTGNVAESTSVYGGGIYDTTNDSADSISFGGTVQTTWVQGNAGNDSLNFVGAISNDTTVRGGKGNDSIRISDAGANNYGLGSILGGDGNDTIRVSLSGNTTGVLVSAMGTIDGGAGSDRIIVGTTASTIATANATAVGTLTQGFNAIIQYGAGDTIVLNTQIASNTFTAIANWSTGNPTLVSLTGAAGGAYGLDNAVTKNAMSGQGNIGIFSDGTDSMILIKNTAVGVAGSTYIRLLIKGADLQLTSVTGQAVSLTQTTFGITVAAQTGGGLGITLT